MQVLRTYREGNPILARIACLLGGAVWGVFWIPLRNLDEAGMSGAWATAIFHGIPLLLLLPVLFLRAPRLGSSNISFHLVGFTMGLSLVLYSTAFLYTDVVRVVALYYFDSHLGRYLWTYLAQRANLWRPDCRHLPRIGGYAGNLKRRSRASFAPKCW